MLAKTSPNYGNVAKHLAAGLLEQYAEYRGKGLEGCSSHRSLRRVYTSTSDESSDGEAVHAFLTYHSPIQESLRP